MAEKGACCSNDSTTLIAACSGRANVGQTANQVMLEVDRIGGATAFCLSGVGAGLSGFIESAKAARVIMVDGCPTGCGKKILERYDVKPFRYFVVTELGIKKEERAENLDSGIKLALGQVLSNI